MYEKKENIFYIRMEQPFICQCIMLKSFIYRRVPLRNGRRGYVSSMQLLFSSFTLQRKFCGKRAEFEAARGSDRYGWNIARKRRWGRRQQSNSNVYGNCTFQRNPTISPRISLAFLREMVNDNICIHYTCAHTQSICKILIHYY